MNELTKRMRLKRFGIKNDAPIDFYIETSMGTKLHLKVDNVSLSGLGAMYPEELTQSDGLEPGAIIPASKLCFDSHEYALGRVVVRTFKVVDGKTFIGFSTVDSKVPIDSGLTRHFDENWDGNESLFEFELDAERFSLASFAESNEQNVDLFVKTKKYHSFYKEWVKTPQCSYRLVRKPSMGPRVKLTKARKNGRDDYIVMGSNDYLGLACHPEVVEVAKKAIDQYGFGATGSPLSTGISEIHEELSEFLAKIFKKERAVLFNSGYAANVGTIGGLIHPQDLIVSDILSHASIQDAMAMSKGTSRFFKHNNVEHLTKLLEEARQSHAGALVITEGVFSMDGDVPPLAEVVSVAKDYKARTFVDEAHSFGVVGPKGLGACEKAGVTDQVDIIMGTFSKICGGIGGFVVTSSDVAEWLYMFARSQMFSVSIPPSTAAAALKALEIFMSDQSLVNNLRSNIKHFVKGLRELGYTDIALDHESAVIPVNIGDEKKLGVMNESLMNAGVFVTPIVYPAVSRTNSRFRFTIMAAHSISDLDFVLHALETAMLKADFKFSDRRSPGKANVA